MGISHVVADGAASMLFITTWAQMARSNIVDPELTPFLDRTVLHPRVQNEEDTPKFDHIEYKRPPMLVGQVDEMEEQKKETTVAVLKLSSDQVELLKRVANEGRENNGNVDNREYNRYESLAGHIWRCASKARIVSTAGMSPWRDTYGDVRPRRES
ncbi:PREDICTED: spermidine hydroxycinnamoyl transferase-like [Nelumbo nucifera]|uniref:Spermidine hydroxycinnamoyl transferase-like n=1 Tax=Nelumbo nucifera TaxID=4432 RepID=A0A1U8QB37_NELNU|nr:PREDICTED: spermidine hydroxycinnamoyl transferase-like [Nelumbo nucifera]